MNAFQDGSWHFKAKIEPSPKRWEVHYFDVQYKRRGVQRFVDLGTAAAFAAKHGGEVKEIAPKPFRLEPAR